MTSGLHTFAHKRRPMPNPRGLKKNARGIGGFDYRAGGPCEYTARQWQEIRQEICESGGFVRWYRGEMWLFSNKLEFLYEAYLRDEHMPVKGAIRDGAGEDHDEQH